MELPQTDINDAELIGNAFANAGKALGMTQEELGRVIRHDRSYVSRKHIAPDTLEGEVAKHFIRIFRALYALVGEDNVKHWMNTYNHGTGGVPREQVQDNIASLQQVLRYLDGMRGKI